MTVPDLSQALYRKLFVLIFLVIVLGSFLGMIRDLILTVVLAATFSGIMFPFRLKLEAWMKGWRTTATIIVLGISLIGIGLPLLAILAVSAREALQLSEWIAPWVQEQMDKPLEQWKDYASWIPFLEELEPYRSKIIEAVSKLFQTIGSHLTRAFSTATVGTVNFLFKFFVGLYSAFFFLKDGDKMLNSILRFLPLTREECDDITEKGRVIIQATIKSLFVIGALQGILVGVALAFLGIPGAMFLGIVVAVLSVIPGVGAPLVWVPAVVYLVFTERYFAGLGLTLWGALVVGLADNFLRPMIIGKDTEVPELLIFLSVLGGLAAFGVAGLILGPVLVSILISALEIYERVFRNLLRETHHS